LEELSALVPLLLDADDLCARAAASFGALGTVLVKCALAYVLLRLGRTAECLRALEPVVPLLSLHPGLVRQSAVWHLVHCAMV
ncbi:hypothetical protein JKP88DRAFT_152077, partial [Tribonema minus]